MQDSTTREQLRQVYQQDDSSRKMFIPAKPKVNPSEKDRLFRACAYCRVSTDSEEQLSSYELQQRHYRQLAQDHPNWDLRKIYADEGISGSSLKNRTAFNEMIEECRKGTYEISHKHLIQYHSPGKRQTFLKSDASRQRSGSFFGSFRMSVNISI